MKKCSDCKIDLELNSFPYDKSRDRFFSVCKSCTNKRTKAYRLKNMDKWRTATKNSQKKYKILVNEWKSQGCIKCGDKRIYVIDAHHIDPSTKNFDVSKTMRGLKIVKKELEKCIPLCSNCHREYHHFQRETRISVKDYVSLQ